MKPNSTDFTIVPGRTVRRFHEAFRPGNEARLDALGFDEEMKADEVRRGNIVWKPKRIRASAKAAAKAAALKPAASKPKNEPEDKA